MSTFKSQYPDFAAIEAQIRRANAERSVAIATLLANGIVAAHRALGRLFAPKAAARAPNGALLVKASVPSHPARV